MLKLHNTLTGKVEAFTPIQDNEIRIFVCGPTVYNFIHIGNGKTYTQFDIAVRALRYLGYNVKYLMNITDIDDKIIARAAERGIPPETLAEEYEKHFLEDMQALGNTSVDKYARAHDYIDEIVSQVKRLVDKGFAYKINDGYYFDTKAFADYGKLSGRDALKQDDAVSRIDENPEKRNPGDFCLWKFKKEGDPSWATDLGEGRPGWHIEDTAITEKEFGPQYDVHGGARDLIFPHHEAEIAQMEAVSGKSPLVRYWMHTGFLNVSDEKMGKSKGNFLFVRDVISQGISPLSLRYYFLSANYRSEMNFTFEALQSAQNAYRRLKESSVTHNSQGTINNSYQAQFKSALENDLNTPEALAVVWKLVKDDTVSLGDKRATLLDFDKVLGLDLEHNEFEVGEVPAEVQELVEAREEARQAGDFKRSDELREEISKLGFVVEDTTEGPRVSK